VANKAFNDILLCGTALFRGQHLPGLGSHRKFFLS
jgi:hypothetical protein